MRTLETETIKNERIELIFPTFDHKNKAITYSQEHFNKVEMTIHGDGGLDKAESYEQWIEKINTYLKRDSVGFVPATTYFAFIGDKIVGTIRIRHRLNEYQLKYSGHTSYGIMLPEHRKGYATEMLRLTLKKCKAFGIEKALVTCDKNNVASAGTVLKNNGVIENEVTDDKGRIMQRYRIEVR